MWCVSYDRVGKTSTTNKAPILITTTKSSCLQAPIQKWAAHIKGTWHALHNRKWKADSEFRQYLSPIVSKLSTSIKTFMQGLLIKWKPLRDLLVSSALLWWVWSKSHHLMLKTPRSSSCVSDEQRHVVAFLAVTWRVQPYNESSAFSEHAPVYAKTYFLTCPAVLSM